MGRTCGTKIEAMNQITRSVMAVLAALEEPGAPALRVAFSVIVVLFLCLGVFALRRRRLLLAQDSTRETDITSARHIREEIVGLIWGSIIVVALIILDQVWSA
jgi:hypothetical protein